MDISSSTNSIYSQYHSLIDRFKNGEIDYREALSQHQELAPQTRDLIGTGTITGAKTIGAIRVNISTQVEQQIKAHLNAQSGTQETDHQHAVKTYQSGTETWSSDRIIVPMATTSIADKAPNLDPSFFSNLRQEFNAEAHSYLGGYASSHKADWKAAARELGINIEGGNYLNQFYKVPKEAGLDVSFGIPNSQAEQIFRHIATTADIAQFESKMSSAQQTMESRVKERIFNEIKATNAALEAFAPHRESLEAAGLTAEDMSGVMLQRDGNGTYAVISQTENADVIENVINSNPELRALYDHAWEQSS